MDHTVASQSAMYIICSEYLSIIRRGIDEWPYTDNFLAALAKNQLILGRVWIDYD